jgi:hypothetical protein
MHAHSSSRVTSFVSVSEMQCAGVRSYILQWYHPCVRHIHVNMYTKHVVLRSCKEACLHTNNKKNNNDSIKITLQWPIIWPETQKIIEYTVHLFTIRNACLFLSVRRRTACRLYQELSSSPPHSQQYPIRHAYHPTGIFSSAAINSRQKFPYGLRQWSYILTMPYNATECSDYIASVTEELMGTEHWQTDTNRRKPKYSEKNRPVPVPLHPPQIPHELAWDQTWASKVTGQHLNIPATASLQHLSQSLNDSIHCTTLLAFSYKLVNRPIWCFYCFPHGNKSCL